MLTAFLKAHGSKKVRRMQIIRTRAVASVGPDAPPDAEVAAAVGNSMFAVAGVGGRRQGAHRRVQRADGQ